MMRRSKFWYGLVFLVALVAQFPALLTGFLLDDYLHASMIHGTFPAHRSPFDLYDFIGDADRGLLRDRGLLPWWSDPGLKIRFFRPLSSALLWGDHKLLGDAAFLLHLHSLVWWVAAVLAARALFERLLAKRAALIATAIFALAPCHTLPLAWLANREALVSLTFGLVALQALLRFFGVGGLASGEVGDAPRDDASRSGRLRDVVLAAAAFSMSLLGGEYGLCLAGYVGMLVIVTRDVPRARRALATISFAVPAAGYLAVRSVYDYGTRGSGFYTDPLGDPVGFLENLPRRFALLSLDGWLSLDGAFLTMSTSAWVVGALFAAALVPLSLAVRRLHRHASPSGRERIVLLLVGSVVATLPVTAVLPSPRLLAASLVGIAPIAALVIDRAWFSATPSTRAGEWGGLVALCLAFFHFVHAPLTSWLVARTYQRSSATFARSAIELGNRIGDIPNAEVFVVRCKWDYFFLPFALDAPHGSKKSGGNFAPPLHWRILAQSDHVLALRRGPRTIDIVTPVSSGMYPPGEWNLFVTEKTPIGVGQTFSLPGMKATVLEMGEAGAPRSVRFETERDLDSYDWTTEEKRGFPRLTPPGVGMGKPFDG